MDDRRSACGRRKSTSASRRRSPADAQARLLGEAWERAATPADLQVPAGRSTIAAAAPTSIHLGAHAPELASRDLDLIHRLWLDAAKAVGPHVHHHDVVRAALTANGRTTERTRTRRGAAADPGGRATGRRAGRRRPRPRLSRALRDMMRNRPAERSRRAARRTSASRIRSSCSGCCRARTRRRRSSTSRTDAQEALLKAHGAGRRRGAAQRHGARRPHDVPRGAAGDGDAAAARAADARRSAPIAVHAARLSGRSRSAG